MKRAAIVASAASVLISAAAGTAVADSLIPGDLLVSGSTYSVPAGSQVSQITVGSPLPYGGVANAGPAYPNVFNNDTVDASFGVTSPVTLSQYHLNGSNSVATLQNAFTVPGIVTSFSSKSELSLNLSTNGQSITFMGYIAPLGSLDVSNANTPGHVDPTNPVTTSFQRGVAQIDSAGDTLVTPVNSYSGNNGRAVILVNSVNGTGIGNYYMVGNAGNGSGTQPMSIVDNTGVQLTTPGGSPNATVVGQQQGTPGAANGYQFGFAVQNPPLSDAADKSGKDDNFRGEAIFNNTLFVTKGSGSNGVDTVYQVGTPGTLPTAATASTTPITILPGLPTGLAKNIVTDSAATGWDGGANDFHPFGIWFANADTLYVADEGSGNDTSTDNPTTDPNAGLEKWTFNGTSWVLDYTLQLGLLTGVGYLPSAPGMPAYCGDVYSDGLRNITGEVNANGTVTIFGITSTVSCSGDQGSDPNELVDITDVLADTFPSQVSGESFNILANAGYANVFRGVAFAPVPEPSSFVLLGIGLAGLVRQRWGASRTRRG